MNAFKTILRFIESQPTLFLSGDLLAKAISRYSGVPAIAIELYDPFRERLRLVGAYGTFSPSPEAGAGDSLSGIVARSGYPLYWRFSCDPRFQRGENASGGVRMILCVPIRFRRETVGVLSFLHTEEIPFDGRFRRLAEELGLTIGELFFHPRGEDRGKALFN
jgi:hypothetical protein